MNFTADDIISWFLKNQPEMSTKLIPLNNENSKESDINFIVEATGLYTVTVNEEKYGYQLLIKISARDNFLLYPEVICIDKRLYPSLNRHILSDRRACLGSPLDIIKSSFESSNFSMFIQKTITPFVVWQLYYDTFGIAPSWGERSHDLQGLIESIADHISKIWKIPSSQVMAMLTDHTPKKRKKCFCGSGLQFRDCHGKHFFPILKKLRNINKSTHDDCKNQLGKDIHAIIWSVLQMPAIR